MSEAEHSGAEGPLVTPEQTGPVASLEARVAALEASVREDAATTGPGAGVEARLAALEARVREAAGAARAGAGLAAGLVTVGLRVSSPQLRQLGFGLLAFTSLKVLLTDTAQLDSMGRVAAFGLIGLVYLGVALGYGKRRPG
ncbi:MAG: hypothetical protein VKS61_12625 [Candidatus Sericytochromatia bacterium]|nr:hypothetical protein [Candidatus Sericytochromatia bacterium]